MLLQANDTMAGTELDGRQQFETPPLQEEKILALPQKSSQTQKHLSSGQYLEVELSNISEMQYTV